MLLHDKFKQTKVKIKIINGSLAPVYKGLEAIECLLYKGVCPKLSTNYQCQKQREIMGTQYWRFTKQENFYQLNIYALTQMPLQMVIPNIEH